MSALCQKQTFCAAGELALLSARARSVGGINGECRQSGVLSKNLCIAVQAEGLRFAIHLSPNEVWRSAWPKGQMRSNREKKKPKQDKNKKKGAEAPSPFAGMHSQVKLGTSYTSQYGKKH